MTESGKERPDTAQDESEDQAAGRPMLGTIIETLASPASTFAAADHEALRFHGIHHSRSAAGHLMLRVRIPAGRLTPGQYLTLDDLAGRFADSALRLTARQTIQFHDVRKADLKALITELHHTVLTTLGTGGDVVRNVMANPLPLKDAAHARIQEDARRLTKLLRPRTRAYRAAWLDGPRPPDPDPDVEPIYGATYLPRKFKIALATADDNSVHVFAQDLGIIALFEDTRLLGYNFLLGGGLGGRGSTPHTQPMLALPVCLVEPEDLLPAVAAVIALYRDHGDRGSEAARPAARFKALIHERGAMWARMRLEEHLGHALAPAQALPAMQVPDLMGWHAQGDGKWFLGLPIPGGRIVDDDAIRLRSGLRVVIEKHWPSLVLTPTQNLLLCDLSAARMHAVETDLRRYGVRLADDLIPLERWAQACPALPTCPYALAEAERVLPALIDSVAEALAPHGLGQERLSLRVSGCGHGCSRPMLGDIGLIGTAANRYRLIVGGDRAGTRLGTPLVGPLDEAALTATLEPLFGLFAAERTAGESFGDFCHRVGHDRLTALLGNSANNS